jgi:hypothetical protein
MNQEERIKQLVKSFDTKSEVIKESVEKNIDDSLIKEESDRLKEIARIDEYNANSSIGFMAKKPTYIAGQGQTVNTFMAADEQNPKQNKMYNPNYTYLQPSEALGLSIKRTLESGAPVKDMDFYDEINWNLNNMGFLSKSALDIKNTILKMLKD